MADEHNCLILSVDGFCYGTDIVIRLHAGNRDDAVLGI